MPQGLSHLEEWLHIRHTSHKDWSIILNISDISYGDRFLFSNCITLQAPPHLGKHLVHITHTSCNDGTIFGHVMLVSCNDKTSKSSFSKYTTRGVSYSLHSSASHYHTIHWNFFLIPNGGRKSGFLKKKYYISWIRYRRWEILPIICRV